MAKSIEAGRAVLKLLLDDKELNKKFAGVQRRMRNVGRNVRSAGLAIGGLGAAITAPFGIAILRAAEAQEVFSKFDTVFGKNRDAIKEWGDEFSAQVGRSEVETAKFLASFQDLLVPVGFDPGEAEKFSKQLVALGTDLASFNNLQDADVIRDLQAALTGSGEVMKKYGVIVSEAAVKQELLNQKLDPKSATEVEKAQARLNIIMAGTTAAQGDAIRTAGSFTNQMKALRARIADAAVEIGTVFLPVATRMVSFLISLVQRAADFVLENKRIVFAVGATGAGLLALGVTLVTVGTAITAMTVGVSGLSAGIGFLRIALTFLATHPIVAALLVVGGVVAWLTDGFGLLSDSVDDASGSLDGVGGAASPSGIRAQQQRISVESARVQQQLAETLQPVALPQQSNMPSRANETERRILEVLVDQTHILADSLTELRNGGLVAGAF